KLCIKLTPLLSPPLSTPWKSISLSLSLPLFSPSLCSCALLSVTYTQQVPLLEQKREKEKEGGCELQSKRDLRSASARGRGVLLSTLYTEGLRSAQRQRLGRGSCVGVTLRWLCRLETGESTDTVDPGGSGKRLLKKETEKRKG
ncbi:hypothetical protein ATANTOWER_003588, partial [Ataeniobius toweri]|nr:hypothetical protein [Ataeniobius toweri]